MPTIIMSKLGGSLDPALKKKGYAFLEKLSENDALPGLHVEPINGSADPRARTARVDQGLRAVLFRIPGPTDVVYVFHGIYEHDEAIQIARTRVLSVNPSTGIAELHVAEPAADNTPPVAGAVPTASAEVDSSSAPAPSETRPVAPGGTPSPDAGPGPLVAAGISRDTLIDDLGIAAGVADAALAAASEDELVNALIGAPEWQADALIELGGGVPLETVREKYALTPVPADEGASEDERLLQGLQHPSAQMSFAWIENNEELRRVIEAGDFGAWRVFLHPEQRKYVSRTFNGPFRLSGGAGTGKTVVLLHRARFLARQQPTLRVVLTTFTRNLAEQMSTDLGRLDPGLKVDAKLGDRGVHVAGIDSLAASILKLAGNEIESAAERVLGVATSNVQSRTDSALWQQALDAAGDGLPTELRTTAFCSAEYAMVVLPHRIVLRDDYYRVRRPGRGVALDRAKRAAFWNVVEAYRVRARIDKTIDYAEAAAIAAEYCRERGSRGEWLADHVLVDEGQDLGPAHWQLLRALVAEGPNDLFIAEDSHQRIYGEKLTLGSLGIRIVGRSQRLTLNYRTTAQNLAWAVGVLSGADFVDLEDAPEKASEYRSARSGPEPRLMPCANLSDELDKAADLVKSWLAEPDVVPETIGVLVRFTDQRGQVAAGLGERGVPVRNVDRGAIKPGQPVVMTMHRAKGTEFSRVLLFGVGARSVPGPTERWAYSADAKADALQRERSLLYVAATRARDELVVSWSGTPSDYIALSSSS